MKHTGFINGRLVEGEGEQFDVENPSDESVVATIRGLSLGQVHEAIDAARKAFDDGCWSGLGRNDRVAAVRRFATALEARADRFRDYAVSEAGCPVSAGMMEAQVAKPLRQAHEACDIYQALPEIEENPLPLHERIGTGGVAVQSIKRWVPHGVCTAIAAYNVPLFTALWKVVPGLLTGNAVILRPNPLTPLSAMLFAEAAIESGLPDGVLGVVIEPGVEGAMALTSDPAIDMVSFTGSCAVGASVAAQAAPTLKRLVLELGGKSAQIFMPDAVDRAAQRCLGVVTSHAGQGCVIGTRVFVPEASKPMVFEAVRALFAKVRIGPAWDVESSMGPVVNAAAVARCEHFVAEALSHGGKVICGGKRPGHLVKGHYFEPTVLDLPDNANPAAQEEIFGPVVSVIGYRDIDHAIAMANDSRFGLSGYVHGNDRAAAVKVALAIRSGTVNLGNAMSSAHVSNGGMKMSGLGRERGVEGLRAFQQISVLNIS